MRYAIRHTQYAVLILVPLILFWRIVFAGRALFWGVPLLQFYPWQQYAVEMWRSGNVPLWNPFVGSGAPLAANLQSAVFYPLNVLYFILPVERAMGYTAVLHVILAGLAMYAWGRTVGLRPLAALVGALAFQLSQFLIARLAFLSITATFPWPAIWLWRAEIFAQRRRMSDALWLALTIGLGLLAGHAQTAGLGLIVVVLYAAIRMIQVARRMSQVAREAGKQQEARGILRSAVYGLLLAFVAGFALAIVQLLPSSELAAQSQRVDGLDYEFASTHSLYPLRLLTFLAPDLMGNPADGNFWGYDNYWENAGYVGLWALMMAFFALVPQVGSRKSEAGGQNPTSDLRPPTSVVWFLGATAVVSVLIALGRFAPFYPLLFRALPGATLFQGPARLLSAYTLSVAALAGIGTERLLQGERLRWLGRFLVVAALGMIVAVTAGAMVINVRAEFVRPVIQLGVTLAACAACLALRPSAHGRWFALWQAALVGMVALDLLIADWRLNPTTDASLYHERTMSAQAVRAAGSGRTFWFSADEEQVKFGRYLSFKNLGPQDASYWLGARETLLPNVAMIERVSSANNFDPLLVGRYDDMIKLLNKLPEPDALRVASAMDARYIVSPRELPLPVAHRGVEVTIYHNDAALDRAWIVPQARVVGDALAALADPAFDLRQKVLFESADTPTLPLTHYPRGSSSITLQDSPNAVTIRAVSESGGFLVLADTFYPGWQATLDGKPTEILRANHAFRSVALPPGEHTVEFRYAPLSFTVGAAISLTTLIIVIGTLVVLSLRRTDR